MADLTFVTPCADYHIDLLDRVKATVAAQTIPCEHIIVIDRDRCGAGWARNIGLAEVQTPFVVFLDSDDELDPRFVEKMLGAWRGDRYIYCDHWAGDKLIQAPNCAWRNRSWHVISALVPTEWAREVGGFDETLEAFEDTEFYVKLVTSGRCGKRLAEPLFHYGDGGQRSKTFINTPASDRIMNLITEKYGRKHMACGDCGDSPNVDMSPIGDPQPGDVLAIAIWAGNRQERGRATGRLYPRAGNGKQMHVNPADISASPHLWQRVVSETPLPIAQPRMNIPAQANVRVITPAPPGTFPQAEIAPVLYGAADVGAAMNDFQRAHFPAPPPLTVVPAKVSPDVRKVIALYEAAING